MKRSGVGRVFAGLTFLTAAPAAALCIPDDRAGTYEFILSKPGQLRAKDLIVQDEQKLAFAARVSRATPLERDGKKRNQRSELRETPASAKATPQGWVCYAFDMQISQRSDVPNRKRNRAKLTLAQFHHEDGPGVLFVNIDPDGALYAEFGDAVGKRRYVLAPNLRPYFGQWITIKLAQRWSSGHDARSVIWIELPDGPPYLAMWDQGRNKLDGQVYQKLGTYRSFIERDPTFRKEQVRVEYRDISRNGAVATFRR